MRPLLVIVDDDPKILATMRRRLARVIDVACAGSAAATAELFSQERRRIVAALIDVFMPDCCGVELACALRKPGEHMEIAICSGDHTQRHRAKVEGFVFFEKPGVLDEGVTWAEKLVARLPETRVEHGIQRLRLIVPLGVMETETLRVASLLRLRREEVTRKRIAYERSVTPDTVKHQIASILAKTARSSLAEVIHDVLHPQDSSSGEAFVAPTRQGAGNRRGPVPLTSSAGTLRCRS